MTGLAGNVRLSIDQSILGSEITWPICLRQAEQESLLPCHFAVISAAASNSQIDRLRGLGNVWLSHAFGNNPQALLR